MKGFLLTVATASLAIASALMAASPAATPVAADQNQQAQSQQQEKQETPQLKSYTGTISKEGDAFMLKDDAGKSSYRLDDQQSASKFEGRRVKVTGTLDAENNLIKVQSIEEAAA